VIAFVLFRRWLRNPAARRQFQRLQLRMPIIGKLTRGFNTARFTRTFSILSASSVPVLEALRIAGEVVTNLPMRDAVADAAARVREGAPISTAPRFGRVLADRSSEPRHRSVIVFKVLPNLPSSPVRRDSVEPSRQCSC